MKRFSLYVIQIARGVHVKHDPIHKARGTRPLKAASLTKRCLVHSTFTPSFVPPHAQPALWGRREPVQSNGKQTGTLPLAPTCQDPPAQGKSWEAQPAAHERDPKCRPLGKAHGSRSSVSPNQHSGGDSEYHRDLRIFFPSSQNENQTRLNRGFGSHLPRMSINFLSREWTYFGTNLFHGIHFFCVGSKWKSNKVGRWPVTNSGLFHFDRGHGNTGSALAHAWNELMLFAPWTET